MTIDRQAYRVLAFVAAAAVLAAVGAGLWVSIGENAVPLEGALALAAGVLVTVLLGGGVMTALFLSDRTGRDL